MERFIEYLNQYRKTTNRNMIEYSFKDIPQSLITYYENISKERKIFWTPQDFDVICHNEELTNEKIQEVKKEILFVKENHEDPFDIFEDVPDWYFDFVKNFYGLSIFRGSITMSTAIVENTMCMKPKCLKNKFFIGQYSGITPKSCPIFTDNQGRIFVYDAENFRNYPKTDSSGEMKRYLKQETLLIAHWDNIYNFLIDECERLKVLFIKSPSIRPINDCAPKNKNF